MSIHPFGRLDGEVVPEVAIAADGIEARIIGWGAVLRELMVALPGREPRSVVLGLDTLDAYVAKSPNFGAVLGRYANRIGHARFPLDGREVRLVANEGRNTLHGGPRGFGKRTWTVVAHDDASAHLALVSPDGEMGFPGRLHALASYEVRTGPALRLSLQAFADAPTPVNLAPHTYFRLGPEADARDQWLSVNASLRLATSPDLVPTGALVEVAGTPEDFRSLRPVRPVDRERLYDLAYVLDRPRSPVPELARAATLASRQSGISVELWTTEPCLQVYDGHKVDVSIPGGPSFGPFAGLALEPQRFPDAPNHAHFPPCTLSPGEVSRQISEFRFATI